MSLLLQNLLDIEKYLLIELAYFHLPVEYKDLDFRVRPLPLAALVDNMIYGESAAVIEVGADGTDRGHSYERRSKLKQVLSRSSNLQNISLIGYINDNYTPDGNTDALFKTSLVAMALRDEQDNRVVVFSGCENNYLRSLIIDLTGCALSALGFPMRQQQAAMRFFREYTRDAKGKIGLMGHSKGGFNATYIYINCLDNPPDVYIVNGQPYCWWRMNARQKAALKSSHYEFILHEGDFVKETGYLSYVSRFVQVNPYLSRREVLKRHCFDMQLFDENGSLEGVRRIRTVPNSLKSRLFFDYISEVPETHDICLQRFAAALDKIKDGARIISYALDEIHLVTRAATVVFMLFCQNKTGDYLLPLAIKGDNSRQLSFTRLAVHDEELKRVISEALPVYHKEVRQESFHSVSLKNILRQDISSLAIVPVSSLQDETCYGLIELINTDGRELSFDDFNMVIQMTELLAGRAEALGISRHMPPASPRFELYRLGEAVLSLYSNDYREIKCRFRREKEEYLRVFTTSKLAEFEKLVVDRLDIRSGEESKLRRWRKRDVCFIDCTAKSHSRLRVDEALSIRTDNFLSPEQALSHLSLGPAIMSRRLSSLTQAEYISVEVARALLQPPMLIVLDAFDLEPEILKNLGYMLRLLCYDMMITVLLFTN